MPTNKNQKKQKTKISYGVHKTLFGTCLIAVCGGGVCHFSFLDKKFSPKELKIIKTSWPEAEVEEDVKSTKKYVERIFVSQKPVVLMPVGTDFQKKVWDALCEIPFGQICSYSDIAEAIGSPKAVRAVGTACGQNNIGFLIPCHRVLTSDGKIGGYKWGVKRKKDILKWEAQSN